MRSDISNRFRLGKRFFLYSILSQIGGIVFVLLFFGGCRVESQLDKMQAEICRVMEKVGPSVVSISALNKSEGEMKVGSGVILEKNYILTTENLLQNSDELMIMLQDGGIVADSEITNVFCDFETNVSLIQLKRENLKPVRLAKKEKIRNGTIGLIIGNTSYSRGLQVHMGTIGSSWIGGVDAYDHELLILSAPSSAYQTGTPVFNPDGELIGLYEGKLEGEEDMILILPASTCELVGKILKENGEIKRGWIGIFTPRRCAKDKGVKSSRGGVLVTEVFNGGPAFNAGLQAGDLIVSCNGEKVEDEIEFRKTISISEIGSRVNLVLLRDGQRIEKEVVVENSKNKPVFRRCPSRSI